MTTEVVTTGICLSVVGEQNQGQYQRLRLSRGQKLKQRRYMDGALCGLEEKCGQKQKKTLARTWNEKGNTTIDLHQGYPCRAAHMRSLITLEDGRRA